MEEKKSGTSMIKGSDGTEQGVQISQSDEARPGDGMKGFDEAGLGDGGKRSDDAIQGDSTRQSVGIGRGIRLRQYGVWLWLLVKRLWRQPAYLALLALIPVLGYAVSLLEQEEPGGVKVAVCVEEGTWSGQIVDGLKEQAVESILDFLFYDSAGDVEYSVLRGEADCGFVIPADLAERVLGGDWEETIKVYEISVSSITGMAKERLAGVIFTLYSEQCYADYMKERLGDTDIVPSEMVDFARRAYESHLTDGSTFSFRYENDDQYSQHASDINALSDTGVFPLKGVFGVLIFICGMCGMLEYDSDRQEKRFVRMAPKWLTYMVDVWIPTIFASFAVMLCLWISDCIRFGSQFRESGVACSVSEILSVWNKTMWTEQILRLLAYQCVIVVYCCILGIVLRRRETIAAAIPVLAVGSFVCAPVFIRLGSYVPIFTVLEKLFPVSYYLL